MPVTILPIKPLSGQEVVGKLRPKREGRMKDIAAVGRRNWRVVRDAKIALLGPRFCFDKTTPPPELTEAQQQNVRVLLDEVWRLRTALDEPKKAKRVCRVPVPHIPGTPYSVRQQAFRCGVSDTTIYRFLDKIESGVIRWGGENYENQRIPEKLGDSMYGELTKSKRY
jgi:hypothetical protein